MPTTTIPAPQRGRPRKFARPARAVTLTLPDDVIAALQSIDGDIARSVVRLAQPHLADRPRPPVELSSFGKRSVIVVPRNGQLGVRTGVTLVPMPDGRALIAFDEVLSVSQLELSVTDALTDPDLSSSDRALFESLGGILREARRSRVHFSSSGSPSSCSTALGVAHGGPSVRSGSALGTPNPVGKRRSS